MAFQDASVDRKWQLNVTLVCNRAEAFDVLVSGRAGTFDVFVATVL